MKARRVSASIEAMKVTIVVPCLTIAILAVQKINIQGQWDVVKDKFQWRKIMTSKFTKAQAGVYAGSIYGHTYVREKMARLLEGLGSKRADLIDALRAKPSEDYWEEWGALDVLTQYCSDDCYFTISDGDLVLLQKGELSMVAIFPELIEKNEALIRMLEILPPLEHEVIRTWRPGFQGMVRCKVYTTSYGKGMYYMLMLLREVLKDFPDIDINYVDVGELSGSINNKIKVLQFTRPEPPENYELCTKEEWE